MHSIQWNSWSLRRGMALLFVGLLLGGCGLASGSGSIDSATRAYADGKYRTAYIESKKVLQKDNKNGKAWLVLGKASLMLGDTKDALADLTNAEVNGVPQDQWSVPMGRALIVTHQFDQALKVLDPDKATQPKVKAELQTLRGDAYRGLQQYAQSRAAYEAALKLDPKNADALVGLAKLSAIDHQMDAANRYLQQALDAAPENPQAWTTKGDFAFAGQDFAGAQAAYEKVLGFKNADWLPQEHFYALARLANTQIQQKELDKALANIETLEKMSPQMPYPHYLHAVILYQQGHLDDAVTQLQQVLKVDSNNAQAQLLMGAVNYAQGNYGQAEMYLSNVMGMDSNNVPARKLLALTFYREGRQSQALDMLRPIVPGNAKASDAQMLAVLQKAAAAGIGTPDAEASGAATTGLAPQNPLARASQAFASGNEAEAIRLLKEMPAKDATTEARRNSLLAMTYLRDKKPDQALKVASDFAARHPDDSAAHLLYGTTLVATGKREQARAQYEKAAKLDPDNIAALLSLGSLDSLEGHNQDAAARYHAVLKKDPKNAAALTSLGRIALQKGDKAEATKWYKQAVDAAPNSPAGYLGLILLYSQGGQFDEAVGTAQDLVKAVPDNAAALNALGVAQLNAGHHAEALDPLQKAVKLAPQVPLYRTNLARAQLLDKDTSAAKANLDEVIKADPGQTTAVVLRAFLKLQDHDLEGAVALARTLQKQPKTEAAGYTLEGDLYLASKSYAKAAEAYQKGLKVDYTRPLVVKTFQALAESGAKQPDKILHEWLGKHPDDDATRLLLGQYYLGNGQNAEAASAYEKVLKAHPSNIGALNNLAWIYTEQRNPKALAMAERAHKLAPDSASVADTYGWALIAANQPKAALPILTKAAKDAPKVPAIQYHLAVAQARTGDKAAARNTLEALQKSGADFEDKAAAEKLYAELGGGK